MKKLLTVLSAIYMLSLTGCASIDMAKEEESYQNKAYKEKLDKMSGKPLNCQRTFSAPIMVDKNGQTISKPNFAYTTPTGEHCLP